MARVARCFGWTLEYVRSLDGEDFERCDRMVHRIEAREQLLAINAAAFPVSKEGWRKDYLKMLHTASRAESTADGEAMDTATVAALLGQHVGG